jgi:hypothetical protein
MADIDLSEFLSGTLPKVPKKQPPKAVIPHQHVTCTQCHGTGKRKRVETHTPELTEKAEELLADLGKVLPLQQRLEELVKCEHCDGHGTRFLANDVRAKQITMFWTRSTCRCGAIYEGPAHQNTCMIQSHVFRPVIINGRHFGWRYLETTYSSSQILPMHRTLPMQIEYFEHTIEACRKCITSQMIICLPSAVAEKGN